MTLLPQTLLTFVCRYFMAFPLTTTWHTRLLSVITTSLFVSCVELISAAIFPKFMEE